MAFRPSSHQGGGPARPGQEEAWAAGSTLPRPANRGTKEMINPVCCPFMNVVSLEGPTICYALSLSLAAEFCGCRIVVCRVMAEHCRSASALRHLGGPVFVCSCRLVLLPTNRSIETIIVLNAVLVPGGVSLFNRNALTPPGSFQSPRGSAKSSLASSRPARPR